MDTKINLKNRSIKFSFLLPIGLIFFISFSLFIFYLIYDQYKKNYKELYQKIENKTKLISMTNISNLWNFDKSGLEQNITAFAEENEIISIIIKDTENNIIAKIEKDKREKLIQKTVDIIHDSEKIGSAEITFTDFFIKQNAGIMTIKLIGMGILLFIIIALFLVLITNYITAPITNLIKTASKIADGDMELLADVNKSRSKEIASLATAFNSMTTQLKNKAEGFKKNNDILTEIIVGVRELIVKLNSSSKEIEAAAQEQTSASNEHASGITEVTATLEELTITAKQITKNVGELVLSSEEVIKLLQESEKQLLLTVNHLEEVGKISANNTSEIGELGKRSTIINEMVEIIKEVANKTNILSINASIEASRSGEAGTGFSVVAAEIRELSKETINSAKNAEKAAKEIQDFLNSIIISSESESNKVIESGKVVKSINEKIENIVAKINNNYSFTQKIDISIKQQETGSRQAADTMKQLAEIARQSAETARQTLNAVKDIVNFSTELDEIVKKFKA